MFLFITCIARGTTRVDGNIKVCVALPNSSRHVDTVHITVESLAKDDSFEWLVKLDGNFHQVFLTLDIKACDLGHILLRLRPD